jgi:hypothetical protein
MFSLIIYFIIAAIGFMMVYLFKQTNTTANFFKPDPQKIFRIFLIVLGTATVITFGFSYLATYELTATNIPDEGSMKFQNAKAMMFFTLNLSFFVLVVLANAYSLSIKKLTVLPYVLILLFYAGFILKDAYYISDYYTLWQHSLKLFKGDMPDFHSTGWVKCGLGFLVTAFNAGIIWLGLRK